MDAAKLLKGQKSVLAAVQSGAKRMRSRLAGTEKVKLDAHLSALADIEMRLGATQYAPISCNSPTAPTLNRPGGADTVPVDTEIHFDMLTQAFACDRTRFVNAGWGNLGGGKLPWIFGDVDDMHGAVAHATEDQTALGATARLRVATLQRWYASRLCELMDRLNAVPESNGTLLDNTLIVWGQDFGEDIHGGLNVPYVLLGGAQGKLKMGRWLDYSAPPPANKQNFRNYQPANKLFVSLLNAFGVQGDTFGSTEFPGPLPWVVVLMWMYPIVSSAF